MIESSIYDKSYYGSNHQDSDRPALLLYQRLVRRYLPVGTCLDFGCGAGYLLKRISRDRKAAGVEASEWAAQKSRSNCPEIMIYDSLDEISDSEFGGIVSIHVVEHIPDEDLRVIFANFRRLLQKDGRLLLVTPDASGWAARVKGKQWIAFSDKTHINLKGCSAWKTFFEEQGFSVEKAAADGLFDFPYPPTKSKYLDIMYRGWPTLIQFVIARLMLPPGAGESCIFLLKRTD